MRLIRLHLQGFKSFKDKTTIHFDDGITGIVGPNGCGKSNIVDALFWVMGEQSAKHLRGNKMRDLIFAGSNKYSPSTFAEVTLVLLNENGKHIHIGNEVVKPTEIALTRKLYKNGETEYRINNQPARLKDIQEVFMDTGAGAKSYSIIAQGEINRLVQAKPEERRTIIEEVAGITKFKMKKRDSLKKIESTQSNLNRLSDLQSEIYKNLKKLEDQADRAQRATKLEQKIKHHELIIKSHKEYELLTNFNQINDKLGTSENNILEYKQRKEELDSFLLEKRDYRSELQTKVEDDQKAFNEIGTELAKKEERLKYLAKAVARNEKQVQDRTEESENLEIEKNERQELLKSLKEKLTELENKNFDIEAFNSQEEKCGLLEQELQEKELFINQKAITLSDLKTQLEEIEKIIYRNSSQASEYSRQLEDISTEIESLEKLTSDKTESFVQLRAEVDKLSSETEKEDELNQSLSEKLNLLKTKYNDRAAELELKKRELLKVSTRLESLLDLGFNDGPASNAKAFFEECGSEGYQLMADIIRSKEGFEKGVERLFEDLFDSVIAHDNCQSLKSWISKNASKSINFIRPLEEQGNEFADTPDRLEIFGLSNIEKMESVIDLRQINFTEKLFDGYYIADFSDPNILFNINPEINFKAIASKDGTSLIRKNNGAIEIKLKDPSINTMGVVERNNLIADLKLEKEKLEELIKTLSLELTQEKELLDETQSKFNESDKAISRLKLQFASKNSEYKAFKVNHEGNSSRLDILKTRKTEISQTRFELIENDEKYLQQKEAIEKEKATLGLELEELQTDLTEMRSVLIQTKSNLYELKAQKDSLGSQLENMKHQIEDNEAQIQKYTSKLEMNNISIEELGLEIEDAHKDIDQLTEENFSLANELKINATKLAELKEELNQLLASMDGKEREVKYLVEKINTDEKAIIESKLKLEQILVDEEALTRLVFEKYNIDLRNLISNYIGLESSQLEMLNDVSSMYFVMEGEETVEFEKLSYDFEKKFPAVVRESKEKFKKFKSELSRLGQINWQAVEDYKRQKIRYDFLRDQEVELKKSMEDLETAIGHIDEKSRIRFKDAFEEVNTRFTKVFPIIFGGGEARLEVVGEIDDITCGIDIIAKPPGKKMQSINLMSGGEKAMTAVSLIFSIFLVKPSPFCLLDEVDAPLDDANVGRFNELLREMSSESQFILITHNKKTMELNDTLYGVTMQEPGVSQAVSVQLH